MKSAALLLLGIALHAQPAMEVLWNEKLLTPFTYPVSGGVFRTGPLAPGEYRLLITTAQVVLAPPASDRAQRGDRVTIRANETTTITVKEAGTLR